MPCLLLAEQTTSDNLLSNGNFSDGLNDWTVEDATKTKYDSNCYANGTDASGLCKSVRWKSNEGKTISQTIQNLEQGYDIDGVNVSFTALGCNNEANSSTWCSQGTDYDKVQATVQLYKNTDTENLYLEQTLDYNDGTQHYSLSSNTLSDWTTDDTSINFSITGIDTGNWSGWYAPIVDNISLTLDLSETVIEQTSIATPQANAEPIIETNNIVEETVTMISGLDLEVSVVNDVILETADIVEIPQVEIIEVAVIEELPVIDDLPVIPETIEVIESIEVVDVVESIESVEEIAEIEEIQIKEIEIDEIAEQEDAEENVEEPTELAQTTMEEDLAEANEPEKKSKKSEKTKKKSKKIGSNSQNKGKGESKSTSSTSKKTKSNLDIPVLFTLLSIQDSITIQDKVTITQDFTDYEQDTSAFSSNVAWDRLNSSTNDNWSNLDSLKPLFSFRGYRKDYNR